MTLMRSLLFVPGHRPDRFDKALSAGADAVVIDLEDAVAQADKASAREAVRKWFAPGRNVMLRINGDESPWFAEDLMLCSLPGLSAIVLPKTERIDALAAVMAAGAPAVLPLIESAGAFRVLDDIAGAAGVLRLAFGAIDFQVDIGMRDPREEELLYFRSLIVLASRLAGIAPPLDGVTTAIDDAELLRVDVLRAKRLGFGGKMCIHPRQVAPIHDAFAPTVEELAWARKIVNASEKSGGATVEVDGRMVDRPVLKRAESILRDGIARD